MRTKQSQEHPNLDPLGKFSAVAKQETLEEVETPVGRCQTKNVN